MPMDSFFCLVEIYIQPIRPFQRSFYFIFYFIYSMGHDKNCNKFRYYSLKTILAGLAK